MKDKEELGCDHFKSIVKISYYKQGSGIIFLPKIGSQYIYILTAKHNFEDSRDNLISLEKLNYEKIQLTFKEYDEDDFINISIKDVIYLDMEIDLAILVVLTNTVKEDIVKILPVLNILDNNFSHCIFKGYPSIQNGNIQCVHSSYHAKTNRKLFTITTKHQLLTFDSSELENTVGFSGSGLLTAFNKKPALTGVVVKVSNSFNEIYCVDLKSIYKDINAKLNEKGYSSIDILESESIELNKSDKIESINNYQTSLSTGSGISEQHKEIIKKLEIYDIEGAKELLERISQPSGETFRLRALVALTDKNLELAFKYLEEAKNKEIIPNDLEFVKGLAYYFSSIDKIGYERITPYPINRLYIKFDQESQKNIKKAQEIFFDLSNKNENVDYDVWYLASLHLMDLKKMKDKAKEFIENNPLHYGAITYIVAFDFDMDLNPSIQKLEEIEEKTINNILDLVNCYNHQKLFDKTIVLLEDRKDKFEDIELLEKCYINTYMLNKDFDEALKIIKQSNNESIQKLEKVIIVETYHETAQWEELIKFYEKNLTIENLYNICKVKAIQNDWEFITYKTDELIKDLQLYKVLDLVITAEFNTEHYKKVLDLLEKYNYLYVDLNDKFKRIKSNSLFKLGNPLECAILLDSLENKTPSDIFTLIDISKKIGDSAKVEKLVNDFFITNKNSLNVREKLQLGNIVKDDSPTFANKIYQSALSEKITDEEKAGLLLESLGMPDNKLFKEILNTSYVVSIDLGNDIKYAIEEDQKSIYQNYLKGNISFHKLDKQSYLIESLYSENKKVFFSRAGNRVDFIHIDSKIKNIYCDISSLVIIDSLDLFENIFTKFETIYIPMNTMEYINKNASITTLKKELSYYIKQRKIFFTDELSEDDLNEEPLVYPLEKSLKYILKTMLQSNSIILFDDRAINKYFKTDKANVFTINDLLYTLFQSSILSKDIYYQKLLLLREKKLLFIPFSEDELIYHLINAKIENNKLVETNELRIMRKHFAFTIQYLQYLSIKNKDVNISEIPIFTNINKVIENIYYELWNIDKDKWDIYVNYLEENFYTLNLGYFLKDAVDNLNEKLLVSLSLSSLIYIGFFMISKEQDTYINKIETKFLKPILYNNKSLFKEFIKTLKTYLLQNYEDKEQDILNSLQTSFIKKLPFNIRNELIEDIEIIEKFNFIRPMKLWDKTVDFDKLLIKIESALNENKKEFFEDFNIYIEEDKILTQNNTTLEIRDFLDDFFILSQNRSQRKQILEKNEDWIDCKKNRKKEIIKKIQSIVDPIKRFKEFEKYKKLSPEHYYESLLNDSKKTKSIDFDYLIPENLLLVSNYFRYELISNYEKNKKIAITELLKDNDLSRSLHKIFALPQELPIQVYVRVSKLSHNEQVELLKRYINTVATPLNIFHLVKLINKTAKNERFAKRIIRRILNKFSEEPLTKIKAYLSVYKYIYYKFKKEFELEKNLLYMLSWGHTDRIFRNFLALGFELKQLEKIFNEKAKFDSSEIFNIESRLNVLHPLELDEVSFLFKGLNYSLEKKLELVDISNFKKYALMENINKEIPSYKLFKDYSLLDNECNSFMDKDYKNFFSYLYNDESDVFSKNILMNFVNNTINDLKKNPDKVELYNILKVIFDNSCVYESNKKDLLVLMLNIDFENIKVEYCIAVLNFISIQNIYLKDKILQENIKNEIIRKCKVCQTVEDFVPYLDILLYLSISSNDNIEDKVRYFADVLKDIETDLNRNILKTMLSNLVLHLPFKESNILVEYLLEFRIKD